MRRPRSQEGEAAQSLRTPHSWRVSAAHQPRVGGPAWAAPLGRGRTGAALTFAGPAVGRQPEAHGAAAAEGAQRVLALVAAQAPGVAPALVDVCKGEAAAQQPGPPPPPGTATRHLPRPPRPSASLLRGQRQRLVPKTGQVSRKLGPPGCALAPPTGTSWSPHPRVLCSGPQGESTLVGGRQALARRVCPRSWWPDCRAAPGSPCPGLHAQLGPPRPCRLAGNLWGPGMSGALAEGLNLTNRQQREVTRAPAIQAGERPAWGGRGGVGTGLGLRPQGLALGPLHQVLRGEEQTCSLPETRGWVSLGPPG